MKRLILLCALPLVLAGCGQAQVSYQLGFKGVGEANHQELAGISMLVIERRLDNMETALIDQEIETQSGGIVIHLTVKNQEIAGALTSQLVQPFTLRIMKQMPDGQGEVEVQGHGSFSETGITEADLTRGESAADQNGKGVVRLTFTEAGRGKLLNVLRENVGKDIGIFVRDRLISKLNVKSDQILDNIIIRDIPNAELAAIFVDDLNVGLHVTFTPLP